MSIYLSIRGICNTGPTPIAEFKNVGACCPNTQVTPGEPGLHNKILSNNKQRAPQGTRGNGNELAENLKRQKNERNFP